MHNVTVRYAVTVAYQPQQRLGGWRLITFWYAALDFFPLSKNSLLFAQNFSRVVRQNYELALHKGISVTQLVGLPVAGWLALRSYIDKTPRTIFDYISV